MHNLKRGGLSNLSFVTLEQLTFYVAAEMKGGASIVILNLTSGGIRRGKALDGPYPRSNAACYVEGSAVEAIAGTDVCRAYLDDFGYDLYGWVVSDYGV